MKIKTFGSEVLTWLSRHAREIYAPARKGKAQVNSSRLPDWLPHLRESPLWAEALGRSANGPRVLIPTSVGGLAAATILEGLLGVALTLRGANVRFLLCDRVLPACLHVHAGKIKNTGIISDYLLKTQVCPGCLARGNAVYQSIGLPVLYYGSFLTEQDKVDGQQLAHGIPLGEIRTYERDGVALGEHALAGALRFFASGNLPETSEGESILRRYFEAALLTDMVTRRIQAQYTPEVAVFHHGIYIPQGIIGEVARSKGMRVVNWQVGYRKKCFIFSHRETYHHTLISEPTTHWENVVWTSRLEEETMSYLKSRWYGTQDWIWFHDQPKHDAEQITRETGLNFSRPTVTLLTNVYWDAQLHYKANAFRDMLDWVLQTIDYFSKRPDLQLAIRIHPAEVRGAIPSRQPLLDEIIKMYPTLPANIYVVPPESQVSTYVLCENSNSVIIYGTKTGVELTAMGIPVIVAGEAWIRNKGLTRDAVSPETYFAILDELPVRSRLDKETVRRAQKYAFHFFFRRFLPIECIEPGSAEVPYVIRLENLEDLLPGKDPGLDVICDGILTGSEFIYPAEAHLGANG